MMEDQKWMMLRWSSLLGRGSEIVAAIVTHKDGQHLDYSLLPSQICLIIQDARTKILDAPLTLIFSRL